MSGLWRNRCAVLRVRGEHAVLTSCGGSSEGETPLPIPNREVKPLSADGTWPARARESRTPPVFLEAPTARMIRSKVVVSARKLPRLRGDAGRRLHPERTMRLLRGNEGLRHRAKRRLEVA